MMTPQEIKEMWAEGDRKIAERKANMKIRYSTLGTRWLFAAAIAFIVGCLLVARAFSHEGGPDTHSSQHGQGHDNHQGFGWGHHGGNPHQPPGPPLGPPGPPSSPPGPPSSPPGPPPGTSGESSSSSSSSNSSSNSNSSSSSSSSGQWWGPITRRPAYYMTPWYAPVVPPYPVFPVVAPAPLPCSSPGPSSFEFEGLIYTFN